MNKVNSSYPHHPHHPTKIGDKKCRQPLLANTVSVTDFVQQSAGEEALPILIVMLESLERGNTKLIKLGGWPETERRCWETVSDFVHLASWTAVAAPIPLLAPVTRATFPRSDITESPEKNQNTMMHCLCTIHWTTSFIKIWRIVYIFNKGEFISFVKTLNSQKWFLSYWILIPKFSWIFWAPANLNRDVWGRWWAPTSYIWVAFECTEMYDLCEVYIELRKLLLDPSVVSLRQRAD